MKVDVVTDGPLAGQTNCMKDGHVRVCTKMDVDKFWAMMKEACAQNWT